MKWVPSWLAESYAILYSEKGTYWFDFDEAGEVLNIGDKRVLSLRLTRLEENGFLISKRDSVDRRKKYFKLLEPNDIFFAYGIQALSKSSGLIELLATTSEYIDFVIGGSYAAYVYSRYASPEKIDIYVRKEDAGKWIALLSNKSTSVSVDDMLSERTRRENIHVHTSLTDEMIRGSAQLDGIRYVAPETLIIEGLKEQTEFSITDAFAILITKRKELNFSKLFNLARYENLQKELGACLEIINSESGKKIFSPTIIHKIHSRINLSRKPSFPRDMTEETKEYKHISERWGLKIGLSKAFVSKIIMDLVRR